MILKWLKINSFINLDNSMKEIWQAVFKVYDQLKKMLKIYMRLKLENLNKCYKPSKDN